MMCADFRPNAPLAIVAGFALAATFSALPAHAEATNHCASYGADYVAVAGSNGCVKIGRHVRVDMAPAPAAAPMGYAALQDGVRHASDLQPMAPFGLNDLFPL
jgi:hypothetical protein